MLNDVRLIGNLGADPEMRYTTTGRPVCNMRIATSRTYTDKNGDKKTITEWHRIVVWGKQAENCKQYLSKGRQVYVQGSLQTRPWEDREGNKRYTTEVVAQRVQFLAGGRRADEQEDEAPSSDAPNEENEDKKPEDVDHRDIPF